MHVILLFFLLYVQACIPTAYMRNLKCYFYSGKDLSDLPIIIADVSSEDSLLSMCKQARVVLNCVGPVLTIIDIIASSGRGDGFNT